MLNSKCRGCIIVETVKEIDMTVVYANSWDASKLLKEMTEEQRDRVRQQLAERKLWHIVSERPYNKDLCKFVEKRLSDLEV